MAIEGSATGPARKHRFDRVESRDTTSSATASVEVSEQCSRTSSRKEASAYKSGQGARRHVLPERPSTSGGTPSRKLQHVHQAKDDLAFNPLTAHQTTTIYYDFPLPGSSPIVTSPSARSPSRSFSSASHEAISMSSGGEQIHSIGMALGSPSHRFDHHQSNNEMFDRGIIASPNTIEEAIDIWKVQAPLTKPKTSKWKTFGGLFGKRHATPSQSFYQLQRDHASISSTATQPRYTSFQSPAPAPNSESYKARDRANSEREDKHSRPGAKRAATAPLNFEFEKLVKPESQAPPVQRSDSGPLLNVDIPDIHLERYSVMFNSVLKPPGSSSSSSLLSRRQATLDKLKTVNEAIAEQESKDQEEDSRFLRPRRATSPQPSRSPAFSLYPGANIPRESNSANPRHVVHGLQRSYTSPAALSPNRQTFASVSDKPNQGEGKSRPIVLVTTPPAKLEKTVPVSLPLDFRNIEVSENSPACKAKNYHESIQRDVGQPEPHQNTETHIIVSLPTPPASNSSTSSGEMTRRMHSQQWSSSTTTSMMSTGTNATSLPSPININKSLPVPRQPSGSTPTRTRVHTNTDVSSHEDPLKNSPTSDEAAAETAASISIARQISVSQRQQRQLLVLAKPRSATVSSPSPGTSSRPPLSSTKPANLGGNAKGNASSSSLDKDLPTPKSEESKAHTFKDSHMASPAQAQARPRNSSNVDQSTATPSTLPHQGPQSTPPLHQQQSSRSNHLSVVSPNIPQRAYGSVRAARLALAGISVPYGEVVLAIDGHGMGSSMNGNNILPGQGGERLLVRERKPSTPTLVEVGVQDKGLSESARLHQTAVGGSGTTSEGGLRVAGNGGKGHMHRKSERVIVETA